VANPTARSSNQYWGVESLDANLEAVPSKSLEHEHNQTEDVLPSQQLDNLELHNTPRPAGNLAETKTWTVSGDPDTVIEA
jgi:hypothetical protein